ncbi:MAG: STAS domain-containing protein [Flexilinea sp.]
MEIQKIVEDNKLTVSLTGRLDTITAPELETELNASMDNVSDLILDFSDLIYLSSAGLRIILSTQKQMNKKGSLTIRGANETIMEIFEATGFKDFLNFE